MKHTLFLLLTSLALLFGFNKVEAQIDSTTSVGGWKLKSYKNMEKIVIFEDTVKGWPMGGSRRVVEGNGALRLQFRSSRSQTRNLEANLYIGKRFTTEFQFPRRVGFAFRIKFFGPPFWTYVSYGVFDYVLIGKSGNRYPFLNEYVAILGTTSNNGAWVFDTPVFVDMTYGRPVLPTEPVVGMEIGIHMNVDSADMSFDWLAFWYQPNGSPDPDYGIKICSFENLTVGVENEPVAPTSHSLFQNHPNPFNPETTIRFQVSTPSHVTLKIFDVLGREVAVLLDREKPIGEHSVQFNGSGLISGIYFYHIDVGRGQFVQTKKMILMK